jgi:hypothetical protein
MKPVKHFVFVTVLVFSLALNTLAGEIDVPGAPAPQPSPRMSTTTDDTTQDTQETTVDTANYLYFEVWAALLSMY